jgi:4-hydroxybutyryl-CoA dehydratase/vinylacetyl-CoA-Delta-isomerase
MTARQGTSGKIVNRMVHIDETAADLLAKLEAVRLVCRTSGCAQRYLTHDALNGLYQAPSAPTRRTAPTMRSASSITCTACRTRT